MATEETESPPFLALNNNVLNFVACSNIEYTLYVRDTVTTKIRTELAPYTSNECCDIYEVVNVWFNSTHICSGKEDCDRDFVLEL